MTDGLVKDKGNGRQNLLIIACSLELKLNEIKSQTLKILQR